VDQLKVFRERELILVDGTLVANRPKPIKGMRVKFQLLDAQGNPVSTATARIDVAPVSNNVTGIYTEATSTAAATTGNLFRYDATAQQYIFNLATKPLSAGTWAIGITLDDRPVPNPDGTVNIAYTVQISLK
jgi:hypothetical protein